MRTPIYWDTDLLSWDQKIPFERDFFSIVSKCKSVLFTRDSLGNEIHSRDSLGNRAFVWPGESKVAKKSKVGITFEILCEVTHCQEVARQKKCILYFRGRAQFVLHFHKPVVDH